MQFDCKLSPRPNANSLIITFDYIITKVSVSMCSNPQSQAYFLQVGHYVSYDLCVFLRNEKKNVTSVGRASDL